MQTFEVRLDLEMQLSNRPFLISQNDRDSIEIVAHLFHNNQPLNLSDSVVRLAIEKPSGLTVFQDFEVVNAEGGVASLILRSQAYVEAGTHIAEAMVYTGSEISVTGNFRYRVERAILDEETTESTNYWQTVHELVEEVNSLREQVAQVSDTLEEEVSVHLAEIEQRVQDLLDQIDVSIDQEIDRLEEEIAVVRERLDELVVAMQEHDFYTKAEADDTFAPKSHRHEMSEVNGLVDELATKVVQIQGKGLSTNDFTNELRDKLLSLQNYDDTEIRTDLTNNVARQIESTENGVILKSSTRNLSTLDVMTDRDISNILNILE